MAHIFKVHDADGTELAVGMPVQMVGQKHNRTYTITDIREESNMIKLSNMDDKDEWFYGTAFLDARKEY